MLLSGKIKKLIQQPLIAPPDKLNWENVGDIDLDHIDQHDCDEPDLSNFYTETYAYWYDFNFATFVHSQPDFESFVWSQLDYISQYYHHLDFLLVAFSLYEQLAH